MTVSWRHMLAATGIAFAAAGGLSAAAQNAGCCRPPSPPPPPPQTSCCKAPTNVVVNVPGVSVAAANVRVGASTSAVASAGASATTAAGVVVSSGGSAGGYGFAYGGGGGYYSNSGVAQSSISGLVLDGGYETKTVMEDVTSTESYCLDKITEEVRLRPVQAMCIDDKNTPHPASRTDATLEVSPTFNGEIYRCIAGTHMQVTLGTVEGGSPSFASGETFSCAKGESLWHAKGGVLQCRPQTPERNCNERSLLRKFGPGVKMIEVASKKAVCEPATRTTTQKVSKQVKVPRAIPAGDLQLDGGVGQGY